MAESTSSSRVSATALQALEEISSVLLVTPRWTRDGGIATHVQASARALAERGLQVHVLAREVVAGESVPGVEVLRSEALMDHAAPLSVRLGQAASLGADVVHLHQLDDPDVVAAFRAQSPVVISAHGYTACTSDVYYFQPGRECIRAHGPGCVANLAMRGCAHTRDPRPLPAAYRRTSRGVQALRLADLAVSHSSAMDRHLTNNEIEPRRVIPLFATVEPFIGSGHEQRRRVVFAGRVVPPKGVEVLVRAAVKVDAEFVVCGEGWQLEAMRRLAHELGVDERVEFRGWLASEELARELGEASVVVLPSVWPEPFGLVGIEAHAAARPVVASATGGIPDWLEDGKSGLLARPGDPEDLAQKLTLLLDDPARQRAMGEAGQTNVAVRFSPQAHVEAILEAYRAARTAWAADALVHAQTPA
jgi:glycosyltransferase involved in cell wall biosynthesis